MSTSARVFDMPLSHVRRQRARVTDEDATAQPASVFADMADGALALHFLATRAGFEFKELKFVMLIAGLCGESGELSVFDKVLAEDHARCTDRTIRQWRADYLAGVEAWGGGPLEMTPGEYVAERQRYESFTYTVAPSWAAAVDVTVEEARRHPAYATDRVRCIEQIARGVYDEIPDAPAGKDRKRKPRKSLRSPVIQALTNARKNLDKVRPALDGLPSRMRAAFLAGNGENIRETLEAMQEEIAGLLSAVSETVERGGVEDIPEISSGIPPRASAEGADAAGDGQEGGAHFRVNKNSNTRKSPDPPAEVEHTPEDRAAFDAMASRLRAPPVRSATVALHTADDDPPGEAEAHEHIARLLKLKLIGVDEAIAMKGRVSDEEFRRELARRCTVENLEAEAVAHELTVEYDAGEVGESSAYVGYPLELDPDAEN
jgi:hypothetical protein